MQKLPKLSRPQGAGFRFAFVPLRTLAMSLAMRATQGNLRVSLPYLDELPTATFSIPAHPIASLLRDSPIHANRLRVNLASLVSRSILVHSLEFSINVFFFTLLNSLWIVIKFIVKQFSIAD